MTQEMVEFWDGRGISWTTRKQSAPRCRQITTPAPSHSIFTSQMLLVTPNQQCQSTEGREAGTNNSLHQESVRQLYTQKDRHTDRWGAAELCFPPVRPAVRACVHVGVPAEAFSNKIRPACRQFFSLVYTLLLTVNICCALGELPYASV